MEKKLIEILQSWSSELNGKKVITEDSFEDAAREIKDLTFEFIEWTQGNKWSKYKGLDWWVKNDKKVPPKNPPFTLEELFRYWLNNRKVTMHDLTESDKAIEERVPDQCCGIYEEVKLYTCKCLNCGAIFKSSEKDFTICPTCYV